MISSPFSNFASNTADEILFPILAVDFVFIDSLQSTVGPVAADESYTLPSPSENGGEALPSHLRDNQKSALAKDILGWNNNVCDVPKTLSQRWHQCSACGLSAARDHVSAQLIDRLGLSLQDPTWAVAPCVS